MIIAIDRDVNIEARAIDRVYSRSRDKSSINLGIASVILKIFGVRDLEIRDRSTQAYGPQTSVTIEQGTFFFIRRDWCQTLEAIRSMWP